MKRTAIAALFLAASAQAAGAQCLTEEQVAGMTKAARAANPTNDRAFLKALDTAVKGKGQLEPNFVTVHYSPGIAIVLMSPYTMYRMSIEESLRKMEPLEEIRYKAAFTVGVSVSQIDAPDIEKIVVQRDGVTVEPMRNDLVVKEMTTRMGAKTALHSGEVLYSCDAFAPTATVTITAIPASGANLTKTLKPGQLAGLR